MVVLQSHVMVVLQSRVMVVLQSHVMVVLQGPGWAKLLLKYPCVFPGFFWLSTERSRRQMMDEASVLQGLDVVFRFQNPDTEKHVLTHNQEERQQHRFIPTGKRHHWSNPNQDKVATGMCSIGTYLRIVSAASILIRECLVV